MTALALVEVLQAAVGFVQYFAGLPVAVVMVHMLGAGLVVATATWLLVTVLAPSPATPPEAATPASRWIPSVRPPRHAGDMDDGQPAPPWAGQPS